METVHQTKLLHICQVCDTEFDSEILLDSHLRSIHITRIKCDLCEFRSISRNKLWKHMNQVHNKKKCSICSAEFDSKFLLQSHIVLIHKIICEICDLIHFSHKQLKLHMDIIHKGKKTLLCNECNTNFRLKQDLTEHMKKSHKKFKCDKCDDFSYYNR